MHRRRLVALAWPVYVELLAGVVAGVIDVAWVARLGADAVAAVAVGSNVENVLLGVVLIAQLGVTVLVSGRRGAGDAAGMRAAIRGGWVAYALMAPALAAGGWAARDLIAGAFLGDGEAAALGARFLAIAMPGIAVYFAQLMVDGVFKGLGDTRTPMRLALLGNLVLLVVDPFLIYGLAFFPRLGVEGAALATVLSRAVALAVGALLLWWRRAAPAASGPVTSAWRSGVEVVRAGAPMAGEFLTRQGGALAILGVVGGFGSVAVAAYGIGLKAMYAATMAFYALRQAATIHVSHTIGAGRADQVPGITRVTLRLGMVLGVGFAAVFAGGAPWIMRAFTADPAVVGAGGSFLRWTAPYLIVLACLIAYTGVLLGGGQGPRLMAVTVAGAVVLVPLAWALSRVIGLPGVWIALAGSVAMQLGMLATWRDVVPWLSNRAYGRVKPSADKRSGVRFPTVDLPSPSEAASLHDHPRFEAVAPVGGRDVKVRLRFHRRKQRSAGSSRW